MDPIIPDVAGLCLARAKLALREAQAAVCAATVAVEMMRNSLPAEIPPPPGFAGSAKPPRRATRPKIRRKAPPAQKRS